MGRLLGTLGRIVDRPSRARTKGVLVTGGGFDMKRNRFHRGGEEEEARILVSQVLGNLPSWWVVVPRGMMEAWAGDRPAPCLHRKWPCRYLRPSLGTGTYDEIYWERSRSVDDSKCDGAQLYRSC